MKDSCNTIGKPRGLILVKKGMAMKGFINNVKTSNVINLKKQIKKGTVKVIGK